jgi:cytochrome c553
MTRPLLRSVIAVAIFLSMSAFPAFSASPVAEGKALFEQACTRCHGTAIFNRSDRKVNSLASLRRQVARCAKAAQTSWNKEQKSAVVTYLNSKFYHFH